MFMSLLTGSWSLSNAWSKAKDSVNKLVKKDEAPEPEGMGPSARLVVGVCSFYPVGTSILDDGVAPQCGYLVAAAICLTVCLRLAAWGVHACAVKLVVTNDIAVAAHPSWCPF